MVFKKLFKKTKEDKGDNIKEIVIRFEDIEDFLKEETEEKKPKLEIKVDEFRKKFIKHFEDLNKSFDELSHSNFERLILEDKRDLSGVVETNRRTYCNKSRESILRAIVFLEKKQPASEMREVILKTFNRLNSFSREVLTLTVPFKKQIKNISVNLKKLKDEIDNFESFFNSEYFILQKEVEAKKLIEKIEKIVSKDRKKQIQKIEINKKINELEKEVKNKIYKFSKIKKSNEVKELAELEKKKKMLEKQQKKIISEIGNIVASVNRQIKRYVHNNKLDKLEESRIISILENPEKILKNELYLFENVINSIKSNLEKIETDKKRRNKFLFVEKKIRSSLGSYVAKYKEASKLISEINNEIQELKSRINIEKYEKEIDGLVEKIEQLTKEKEESEKDMNEDEKDLIKELEKILSEISGKKVEIK
jgi:hypothetical protein